MNLNNLIAFVAFRKGSKGLKDKNILPYQGKPLFEHVLEKVKQLELDTFVCTDYNINQIAKNYNNVTLLHRPAGLSGDNVSINEVIKYMICQTHSYNKDILLIQVTQPKTAINDIKKCINLYRKNIYDLVTIVKSIDNQFLKYGKVANERFYPIDLPEYLNMNRQDLPNTFKISGGAYIFSAEKFCLLNAIPNQNIGCILESSPSIDIDTYKDYLELISHEN